MGEKRRMISSSCLGRGVQAVGRGSAPRRALPSIFEEGVPSQRSLLDRRGRWPRVALARTGRADETERLRARRRGGRARASARSRSKSMRGRGRGPCVAGRRSSASARPHLLDLRAVEDGHAALLVDETHELRSRQSRPSMGARAASTTAGGHLGRRRAADAGDARGGCGRRRRGQPLGGGEQGEGLGRGRCRCAPRRAQVLAEELSGVEQADVGTVPLHVDAATDPDLTRPRSRRDARSAERLERQRSAHRPGACVRGCAIGPAPLPAVASPEPSSRSTEAAQRRLLRRGRRPPRPCPCDRGRRRGTAGRRRRSGPARRGRAD